MMERSPRAPHGCPITASWHLGASSCLKARRGSQDKNLQNANQAAFFLASASSDTHSHNVALLHYEVLDTIDFDLGARQFAEQDAVADLDVDRDELAALVAAPRSNGG
jgi:hypothetical protein